MNVVRVYTGITTASRLFRNFFTLIYGAFYSSEIGSEVGIDEKAFRKSVKKLYEDFKQRFFEEAPKYGIEPGDVFSMTILVYVDGGELRLAGFENVTVWKKLGGPQRHS